MPSVFDNPTQLREMLAPPAEVSDEPPCNFPLEFYEQFLREIKRLNIQVITFRDLFEGSDDWDYRSNFPRERAQWKKTRDPRLIYLVIQHDVDGRPHFTQRMVAMEALHGIRSNIFIFRDRGSKTGEIKKYKIDHEFFQEAQQRGFVVGYHQNALHLAKFNMNGAVERFRFDVQYLRTLYDIQFFVPHGGVGREIDGVMCHNLDVPMPPELEGPTGRLRWVYNGYGPEFHQRWSDGGLVKIREPRRVAALDIIRAFLHQLKPGTRSFALIHPQRWGYNVNPTSNPLLAQQPWYQELCAESQRMADDRLVMRTSPHA